MIYKINHSYEEFISNREAVLANLSSCGLFLKFLWKNPNQGIVKNFSKEPFFQLYFKSDLMFLLIKFEELNWIDIPCIFTLHSRNLFSSEFEKFPCKILLANSNTGRVLAHKNCFMPAGITKAFIQGIHIQKELPRKTIIEKINSIRSSYSASEMSRLSLGKHK